jgi:hypothetical protein
MFQTKDQPYYIRCVRGWPTTTVTRFAVSEPVAGEPVVADWVTGLDWQGCPAGVGGSLCATTIGLTMYAWQDAFAYCEGLSWGGADDWRLPNVLELDSIVDSMATGVAIDGAIFPGTAADLYVTATTFAAGFNQAYDVYFGFGNSTNNPKTHALRVRCVRTGS